MKRPATKTRQKKRRYTTLEEELIERDQKMIIAEEDKARIWRQKMMGVFRAVWK